MLAPGLICQEQRFCLNFPALARNPSYVMYEENKVGEYHGMLTNQLYQSLQCALHTVHRKNFTLLTYKVINVAHIPLAYIWIKGTCTRKHPGLCDVWSSKVGECYGMATNQMY